MRRWRRTRLTGAAAGLALCDPGLYAAPWRGMDDHHRAQLDRCYGGRRWIVATDILQGATSTVAALHDHGADAVMVVAGGGGVGPVPDVPVALLNTRGATVMEAIRAFECALVELDGPVRAKIEAFDPTGDARVIGSPFTAHATVAGRAVHGTRHPSWRLLEDKTVVDALWDDAGVPRAPSAVVDVDHATLVAASATLDEGAGVVWAVDNRQGFHGGAAGLRWVRSPDQVDEALALVAPVADRVRVMPFLEGLPCSIHGIAFNGCTVALRPCEMIVLRRPGRGDLQYAGTASTWDPPPARRDALRALAVRVGDHLRASIGYRGVFTIDGVMTRDGFRPTELNPRFGAAAHLLAAVSEVPLYLVHLAVVERTPADWRSTDLAGTVVDATDRVRAVRSLVAIGRTLPDDDIALAWEGDRLVRTDRAAGADVTVRSGPSHVGGAVQVRVDAGRVPPGRSVAPVVAAALGFADAEWGLGLGPLEPAPDLTAR